MIKSFSKLATPLRLLVVVLLIGLVVFVLEITNTTHLFHSKKPSITTSNTTTANSETKGEPSSPGTQSNSSQSTSNSSSKEDPSTSASLVEPSGTFVSNHHLNLSGSPAPNQIQSVCNTTPGASCQIIFSKDGVTKSLPGQTTDKGGAAYWTWKLQDIGLTEGTWHIQAKATLGSQVKTSDDALNLEVQP